MDCALDVQEVAVNDNFAKFTESLYVAEQSARQAVEMRSKVQQIGRAHV